MTDRIRKGYPDVEEGPSERAGVGERKRRVASACVLAVLVAAGGALSATTGPVAVSPGDPGGPVLASPCPTFSWSAVPGVAGYRLVVYELGDDRASADPVLEADLPGGATSWTPSRDRCLVLEATYAWTVAAVEREGVGRWSEPAQFRVEAAPAPEELEWALGVLRRHQAAAGEDAAGAGDPAPAAVAAFHSEGLSAQPKPLIVSHACDSGDLCVSDDLVAADDVRAGGFGAAKAAVRAFCSNSNSNIVRAVNNVNSTAITIANGAIPGQCVIDFGFPLVETYMVASARANASAEDTDAVLINNVFDGSKARFTYWDADLDGNGNAGSENGSLLVLVF